MQFQGPQQIMFVQYVILTHPLVWSRDQGPKKLGTATGQNFWHQWMKKHTLFISQLFIWSFRSSKKCQPHACWSLNFIHVCIYSRQELARKQNLQTCKGGSLFLGLSIHIFTWYQGVSRHANGLMFFVNFD